MVAFLPPSSMRAAFLLSCCTLSANALDLVNYGAFTPTATYSIANQLGLFTNNNLDVSFLQVPKSTYGYNQLLEGNYDVLTGTIDKAVNLRFNQHQNLTVLDQLDGGLDLVVASVPSITSIPQTERQEPNGRLGLKRLSIRPTKSPRPLRLGTGRLLLPGKPLPSSTPHILTQDQPIPFLNGRLHHPLRRPPSRVPP